jgi:hypothetical protein
MRAKYLLVVSSLHSWISDCHSSQKIQRLFHLPKLLMEAMSLILSMLVYFIDILVYLYVNFSC